MSLLLRHDSENVCVEVFYLESKFAPFMMKKRRSGAHVHHHTLKTIRAVVLGKDGVGKSGTLIKTFSLYYNNRNVA